MRLFSKIVLSAVLLSGLWLSQPAQASVFYWESEGHDVSVTFPDRWTRIHNQGPHDVLTVRIPAENDHAICKISAEEDGRFNIYPLQYGPQIQRLHFSDEMWSHYYEQQTNAVIHAVYDDAQLGRGWASFTSASYETAVGPKMVKRSLAFASLYRGIHYTVECSAQEAAYDRYHDAFMSFMKSIDFKVTTNHALSGYYRNFIADCGVKIRGRRLLEDSHY